MTMTDRTRRRKVAQQSSSADADAHTEMKSRQRRHARKRRKKGLTMLQPGTFWRVIASVVSVSVLLVYFGEDPFDKRPVRKERILRHIPSLEYEAEYTSAYRRKGMQYRIGTLMEHVDYISSNSYGGEDTKCSLTVVLLDPRLPSESPGQPVWFALESAAMHTDDAACFLLQTSRGKMSDETGIFQHIYHRSLPHFRRAIEQNRVRVTILNHTKYHMRDYDNFDANAAFLNVHYWRDEFIEADSDVILVMQADTVFCRQLDLARYQQYAWVGAVWPPKATANFPLPMEGMCRGMPARWKSWLRPQRKWEKQQAGIAKGEHIDSPLSQPHTLLNSTFPNICEKGVAPVGNGGLSLRSRTWMIQAIESCPHDKLSGIDNFTTLGCKVLDMDNEDFYFATILRGMGAPLPNGYEAALFSSESLWPEEVLDLYYDNEEEDAGASKITFEGRVLSLPTCFHKPWAYQSNDLLLLDQLEDACPLLRYIFEPEQSRYKIE